MSNAKRVKIGGNLYRQEIPDGAIRVTRPSRYGNPYKVTDQMPVEQAVAKYRTALLAGELRVTVEDIRRDLAGKDLACWCPIGQPCHGDVLLQVANN